MSLCNPNFKELEKTFFVILMQEIYSTLQYEMSL